MTTSIEQYDKSKLLKLLQCTKSATPKILSWLNDQDRSNETTDDKITTMWNDLYSIYKKSDEDGMFHTSYQSSKNARESNALNGRQFAVRSSLQRINRIVRHTIATGYNVDIDMENAHVSILISLCDMHQISCLKLKDYAANRKTVLKSIQDELQIDYQASKVAVLRVINGGSKYTSESLTLRNLHTEISKIAVYMLENDISSDFIKQCNANTLNKEYRAPLANRCMIGLVNDLENDILLESIDYFRSIGIKTGTLCFDGFFVICTPETEVSMTTLINSILDDLNAHILSTCKMDIKFIVKPMDEGLDVNNLTPDEYQTGYCQMIQSVKSQIDITSDYTWGDFQKTYQNKVFSSYEELCFNMRKYGNRVVCVVRNSDSVLIKFNKDQSVVTSILKKSINNFNMYYQVDDKKKTKISIYDVVQDINLIASYSDQNYYPDDSKCPLDCYNLWSKPCYKLVDSVDLSVIQPIIDLIRDVWANNDDDLYKWILSWIRETIFNQSKLIGTSILAFGKQGTGKDTLANFIGNYVLGDCQYNRLVGLDALTEKHSCEISGTKLMYVNELCSVKGEFLNGFDRLKSIVSDPIQKEQPKFEKTRKVSNYISLLMATNNAKAYHAEQSDRRCTLLELSSCKIGDKSFWDSVYKCMNFNSGDNFATWLYNLNDLPSCSKPYETTYKTQVITLSESNCVTFINELITHYSSDSQREDVSDPDQLDSVKKYKLKYGEVLSSVLYEKYSSWCITNGEKHIKSSKFFGLEIKILVSFKSTNIGMVYKLI